MNQPQTITDWCDTIHQYAKEKGWWHKYGTPESFRDRVKGLVSGLVLHNDIGVVTGKLLLIHSEVTEAAEALRDGKLEMYTEGGEFINAADSSLCKPEGMVIELADTIIRIMDLCEALGLDLEEAMRRKMAYNNQRSHKHGGRSF